MNVDPHEWHLLTEPPTHIGRWWWGTCKCGMSFRGITRQDIYLKAQTHINENTNYGGGGDVA